METVFGALFKVVKEVVKQGWAFKEELTKMRKKMEDLEPLIKEVTRLNVELDLSRNNANILEVLSEGVAMLTELSVDGKKSRFWKFSGNTGYYDLYIWWFYYLVIYFIVVLFVSFFSALFEKMALTASISNIVGFYASFMFFFVIILIFHKILHYKEHSLTWKQT
jgi:hypothetical protein